MRALRRLALIAVMASPTIAAAVWTVKPAALTWLGAMTFKPSQLAAMDWQDPEQVVNLQRHIQMHFLRYDTYIALEDVVIVAAGREAKDASAAVPATPTSLTMQKACGRGTLYIWVPLKFRLPMRGAEIVEWCWKPQIIASVEANTNA